MSRTMNIANLTETKLKKASTERLHRVYFLLTGIDSQMLDRGMILMSILGRVSKLNGDPMWNMTKSVCKALNGQNEWTSRKLSPVLVNNIRSARRNGTSWNSLSEGYGLSMNKIKQICSRKSYKDV